MRAFERQPGESSKAFDAFKVYRDLGDGRSLAKTAEVYYGARKNLAQMGVWSSKFSWVERVRAFDDWQEMIRNDAIEQHETSKATEIAERQTALREEAISAAEKLAGKIHQMANWPIAETRTVAPDKEGEMATHIIKPARWSFRTAIDGIVAILEVAEPKTGQEGPSAELEEFLRAFNAEASAEAER